jgi:hypothetical protein
MKKIIFSIIAVCFVNLSFAQWTTSVPNIYYTGGNVGIGTTNPTALLHILGPAQHPSSGNTVIIGTTAGSNLRLGYNTNYSWIQSHGSKPLYLNESGNDVIINATNGNVGIGTASPSAKLEVNGATYTNGLSSKTAIHIYSSEIGNTSKRATINTLDGDNTYIYNYDETNNTFHSMNIGGSHSLSSGLMILGNGNAGVGVANPLNKFQIGSNPAGWSNNDLVISNNNGGLAIYNAGDNTYI